MFCLASLFAPQQAASDDWLPIDPADLALTTNPASPGSHAMVLYSETKEDLEKATTSYYQRIKIFDDAGRKYAQAEIDYRSDAFSVEDLHARTIHPDGTIVQFSGEPVHTRKRDIDGSYPVAKLTCPAATPGSIVEFRYRIRLHFERAGVRTRSMPLTVDPIQANTASRHFYWPIQGALFIRRARYTLHPREAFLPGFASTGGVRPGYPQYRTENFPPNSVVETEKPATLVCEARDVPPLLEAFPPPERELAAHIEMYYAAHARESREQFWGRYAAFQRAQEDDELKSLKLAREIVDQTVASGDAPEALLRKLYARTQQIRNRTFAPALDQQSGKGEAAAVNLTAEDVLRRGEGTSQDINLAFLALARAAGFEAQWIRLAPRDLQRFNLDRFDWGQLSGSVVWVRVGTQEIALDPGTAFCPYGSLPWTKSQAGGFRVSKGNVIGVSTPAVDLRDSRIDRRAELRLSGDGSLDGSMQADFYGQHALELRIEALGMDPGQRNTALISRLERWLPAGSKIESLSTAGWESSETPLHAQFRIAIPAQPADSGGVAVSLTATVAGQANPFESPERVHAVAFPFPYQESDEITIALPPGIETVPLAPLREARLMLPGQIVSPPENGEATGLRRRQPGVVSLGTYQNLRKVGENSITVARTLVVGVTDVPVPQYAKLREFFEQVQAGDSEALLLRTGPARRE